MVAKRRFPLLPEVKIEWAQVWRARRHVRSWISRSFKNASVRRLVCDGALSSCHHQLDVPVPRCAMQCGKCTSSSIRTRHSALMRTPSSMKHGGKTMPFTIAAPTVHEPLAQLSDISHCPVNTTTHGAKIANKKKKLFEQSSSIIIHHRYDRLTCTQRAAQSASNSRSRTRKTHQQQAAATQQQQKQ